MTEPRKLGGQTPQQPSQVANTKGAVVGIMGLPHAGKTSLIDTLFDDPDCYPVCGLNNDGGMHVVQDRPGQLEIYTPRDYMHLEQMVDQLCDNPAPFKSIWLDAITYLVEDAVERADARGKDGRDRQIAYGDANFDVIKVHRQLITDLAMTRGVNVFLVYHATRPQLREKSGETVQIESQHIALSNTLALKVEGLLDILVFVEKRADAINPYPPRMRLHGSAKYETRLRLAPTNPLKSWPPIIENPSLSKLVRAFKGEIQTT